MPYVWFEVLLCSIGREKAWSADALTLGHLVWSLAPLIMPLHDLIQNKPLKDLTTFRTGGTARYFCRVRTIGDVADACSFTRDKNLTIFVLGGGSNILVSDSGYDGLVIKNEIEGTAFVDEQTTVSVIAGAGVVWDELVEETVSHGLYGLENLSLIPGTVGAAPIQNIGAYGVEVCEAIVAVDVYDAERFVHRRMSGRDCDFSYRSSIFKQEKGKRLIVTAVHFQLKKGGELKMSYPDVDAYFNKHAITKPTLKDVRKAIIYIRRNKLPDIKKIGTAGSFFKNPIITPEHYDRLKKLFTGIPGYPASSGIKVSLGWLLDHVCHLKGFKKGNVGLYEKQALAIVNNSGRATTHEIRMLADFVSKEVYKKTGIAIEPEVQFIGNISAKS